MKRELPARWFLIIYVPVLIAALVLLMLYSRPELHLAMNKLHSGITDSLMKVWTLLGDGLVVAGIAVLLLFVSVRHSLVAFAAFAFGGLGAQLLKRLIFPDVPRPMKYFELHEPGQTLRLVEGVKLYSWMSFPSGHTSVAFAVFFAMALITRNRALQAVWVCAALGVGVSRIYLSQHFLVDVVAGSMLGMATGFLSWWWIRRYRADWLDKPVQQLAVRKKRDRKE